MAKSYTQLMAEIEELKKRAAKARDSEVRTAIATINDFIARYALSAADLTLPKAKAETGSTAARRSAKKPAAGGARYQDDAGNSWSGRGPRPQWLRTAMAAGKSLESFLTSAVSQVLGTVAPAKASAKPKAAKAKTAGVPKYRDPKSGATWSGRGPQPEWLKAGLRKRGATLAQFLVDAPAPAAAPAVADKPAAKKVAGKRVARKVAKAATKAAAPAGKAAAKKVVAKKAVVKKAAAKKLAAKAVSATKTVVKTAAGAKPAVKKPAAPAAAQKKVARPARKATAKTAVAAGTAAPASAPAAPAAPAPAAD